MKNESGLEAVEYKVVVLPDPIPEQTKGGIWRPDIAIEREKNRTVKATLVSIGGNAFEDWAPPVPEVGSRVYVAVGAGIVHEGPDGKEYRIVRDKDIAAILVEAAEQIKEGD